MLTTIHRRFITTFFIGALMCVMFLAYAVESMTSSQMIAVAVPLLAIYHYKRRVWLTCTYCVYATFVVTSCTYFALLMSTEVGINISLPCSSTYIILVASLVLWTVIVLMTWLGWLIATKNRMFKYSWQSYMFANCITSMTGIVICLIVEKPIHWFNLGGKYLIAIGLLYLLVSFASSKVTCK